MTPTVCVLMPTMNRPDELQRAILAIQRQTYQRWMLFVVWAGTAPKTNYDARVFMYEQSGKGITQAVNQALAYTRKLSADHILNWSNDDDEMLPDTMQTAVNTLSNTEWMYGKINLVRDGQIVNEMGAKGDYPALKKANFVPQPSVFWHDHGMDFNEDYDLASDYEFWLRLMRDYQHIFVDKPLANYHLHPNQNTRLHTSEQITQANQIRGLFL